jgi:hypothetical protein
MRLLPICCTVLLGGCAGIAFRGQMVPFAGLYADSSTPVADVTNNDLGKKKGEACATSILGWITTGDAGIRDAADAGGITNISSVDSTYTNILGIFAKYCTVVSGDAGPGRMEHPEPTMTEPTNETTAPTNETERPDYTPPAEPAPAPKPKPK